MFFDHTRAAALCATALTFLGFAAAQDSRPQFMTFEAAQPILGAMPASLPAGLRTGPLDAVRWDRWLKSADTSVRQRLEAGEEDTLTNLLRFGVTFTTEYRIDDEYFARFGESTLVNSFAEHRARDLVRALAAPGTNPGFLEMRAFLVRKGYRLQTAVDRAAAQKYLLKNMARMHQEFLRAKEEAKRNRSQMFQDRGISLDSNLWPDYDLDLQLRNMAAKGLLKPGSVRRVAIVGPGLDFVNKQEGVDFYPPQSVQPFAVLDSLVRLGLADSRTIDLRTMDISSLVNAHLDRIHKSAAAGRPYTVQLPWFSGGRWSAEFRARFTEYWHKLGSAIGDAAEPIAVPAAAANIETRAVRIRGDIVSRVEPIDMNIVYQAMPLPAAERFDLIIGTNIFLYYGAFEQSLARNNIASMLKSGGYLLSNDKLADCAACGIELAGTTEIPMTEEPVITDYIFCYRQRR